MIKHIKRFPQKVDKNLTTGMHASTEPQNEPRANDEKTVFTPGVTSLGVDQ